jgi:hypothetical protein
LISSNACGAVVDFNEMPAEGFADFLAQHVAKKG